MKKPSLREQHNMTLAAMAQERQSFVEHWKDISTHLLPYRGRFLSSEHNVGTKRNKNIVNSKATFAANALSAGMMTGITSPARPWFKLATSDPDLMKFPAVKEWLERVERILRDIMAQSNFYNVLHNVYAEIGAFGTASMMIIEDFDNVIHCYAFTAGEYYVAQDHRNIINTHYRKYSTTVLNAVKHFGYDNVSAITKRLYDDAKYNERVQIIHAIEPREDRNALYTDAKNKAFASVYYEEGDDDGRFLRNSGFDEFPCMIPRWQVVGQDIYATSCPAMVALGDVRQLQHVERRKAEGIDKLVRPAMKAPASMKNKVISGLPGGVTFTAQDDTASLQPSYEVNPTGVNYMMQDIKEVEFRISRAFYEDLFLMISQSDRRQITAREIDERHEEKLLMLGPVLERLNNDLLDKAIDRIYGIAERAKILPPPPPEIEGLHLNVQYVSILQQAQQAIGLGKQEQFTGYALNLAQAFPEVLHKMDALQMVDNYARDLGVAANVVRSNEEVQEKEQAAAQAQQQAQMQQALPDMARAAKDISQVQMGDANAIEAMMGL